MYQKPRNGQGESGTYLLKFNLDDEVERRAWEVKQMLAAESKLKSVLIGFLLAVRAVEEQTGREVDMMEFTARFVSSMVTSRPMSGMNVTPDLDPSDLPTAFIGTAEHADPAEARGNFAANLGGLFDDEDDDLWDD